MNFGESLAKTTVATLMALLLYGLPVRGFAAHGPSLTNATAAVLEEQVVQTTCTYHDRAQGDHQNYSTLVHCRGTRTCFAMVTVKSMAIGPVVIVQNQGCWKDNAEEECHKNVCLIDKQGIPVGTSKPQFCCCKGPRCNTHIADVTAHKTAIISPPKDAGVPMATVIPDDVSLAASKVRCAYYHEGGKSGTTAGTVTCHGSRKCFAAVVVTAVNSSYKATVASQGCWQDEHSIRCNPSACLIRSPPQAADTNNVSRQFCCCYGDLCNQNITSIEHNINSKPLNVTVLKHIPRQAKTNATDRNSIILSALSSVFIVSVLVFVGVAVWRYARLKKQQKYKEQLKASPGSRGSDRKVEQCPHLSMDNISYGDVIHKGEFSTMHKAHMGSRKVLVKTFQEQNHGLWEHEKEIYTVLSCHPNVAQLIAASEVRSDLGVQTTLVLEDCSQGTLMHYLQCHTISWDELLKMMLSLASGLAFIHGEVDEYLSDERIVVVHRNINSGCVLVKSNGSCALADFGFASQIVGDEDCAKVEAGTALHYTPPEVLGGAVNWHDWESALKQADIYSLSLVLWEMCCRCKDLYNGSSISKHSLPYEKELQERGLRPSVSAIEMLVVRQLVRPSFPHDVSLAVAAHRLLTDTIEECWDHEPEARLTALCVVRRIQHIKAAKNCPAFDMCNARPVDITNLFLCESGIVTCNGTPSSATASCNTPLFQTDNPGHEAKAVPKNKARFFSGRRRHSALMATSKDNPKRQGLVSHAASVLLSALGGDHGLRRSPSADEVLTMSLPGRLYESVAAAEVV